MLAALELPSIPMRGSITLKLQPTNIFVALIYALCDLLFSTAKVLNPKHLRLFLILNQSCTGTSTTNFFLAELVALHFTPMSKSVSRSFELA